MSDLSEAAAALVAATEMMALTRNQFLVWAAGSARGGPNHDGRYPFTQPDGTVMLVPCPASYGVGGGGTLTPLTITLWAGQSNMSGTQVDKTVSYTADPLTMAFNRDDGLVAYAPNVFTGYEYTLVSADWAAELRYAQRFRTAFPSRAHLILKFAARGTGLFQTADGTGTYDWNVNSVAEFFAQGATYVAQAIAAARAAGYDPNIRLLHWQQGEDDSTYSDKSAAYQANLMALIAGFRDTTGWQVPPSATITIGRLSSHFGGTYRDTIRAAETYAAEQDAGGPCVLIDCDGLALESDFTHFTNAGQLALGDLIADADQLGSAQPDVPGAITDLAQGEVTSSTIALEFTAPAGATSYQYRFGPTGTPQTLASNGVIAGLNPSSPYAIYLRALNVSGAGPWTTAALNVMTAATGPGNILANGTFANSTHWTALFDGRSIGGGKLHYLNAPVFNSSTHADVPFDASVTYTVTLTISGYVAGSIGLKFIGGTPTGFSPTFNADGTYSFDLEANAGNNELQIMALGASGSGPTTLDIDDITIVVAS